MAPKRNPPTIFKVSEEEFHEHDDSYDGICLSCGDWTCGGVEPDARNYPCESCGAHRVCGAAEALILGRVEFV